MTINSALPILFPSRSNELPIKVFVINGDIREIHTTVDNNDLLFSRDGSGLFTAETLADIDSSFINHIEVQLNRVFS